MRGSGAAGIAAEADVCLLLIQIGKLVSREEHLNGSALPWHSRDKAVSFQRQNHLMHTWRCDLEIPLHFSLGRRTPVELCVVVDEGEILALFLRGLFFHG